MESARYVGRVGALAVALGIGTAIANSSGVASATPDDGADKAATSSSSTESSASKPEVKSKLTTMKERRLSSSPARGGSAKTTAARIIARTKPDASTDRKPGKRGESPLASLALAAARRETQKALTDDPNARVAKQQNTQQVIAAAAVVAPTVSAPDQTTGAISGSLNGHVVSSQPASGTVTVSGGGYTYRPTQAARLGADLNPGADYDSFGVTLAGQPASAVKMPVLPAVLANQAALPVSSANNPTAVAVSSAGLAYVTNQGGSTVSVLNTTTGAAVATIGVGSQPSSVALSPATSRAYVTNRNSKTVSVINTATNTVVSTVTVGTSPQDVAVNTAGTRAYVINNGSNNVSVINTANNSVTTIGLGATNTAPTAVALNADGSRAYVTHRSLTGVGKVSVINTATNKVISTVNVGRTPTDVAVVGSRVYVANNGSGSVSVINVAADNSISTVSVGGSPSSLAVSADGSIVAVARSNDDTITVIDVNTDTVIGGPHLIDAQSESGSHAVAFAPDGRIFITDSVDKTVRVVGFARGNTAPVVTTAPTITTTNLATGAVSGSFTVSDPDYDVLSSTYAGDIPTGTVVAAGSPSSAGGYIYTFTYTPTAMARQQAAATPGPDNAAVSIPISDGRATVMVNMAVPISAEVPADVTAIGVGLHPIDEVISGNRLYVSNSGNGSVSVIDTATNQVVDTIPDVGYGSVLASSDGRYLYVGQYDSYTVAASVKVVDTSTRSVIATVTMPKCEYECWANSAGMTDMEISPDNSAVYVSELWIGDSFYAGTLTKIDTTTNTVVAATSTSQYGDFYSNIEVSPDGTRLYAASGYPYYPQIDVLDARTLALVGTASLDRSPGWPPLSVGSLTFSPSGERAYARTTEIWPSYTSPTFAVIDTKPDSATYNTQIATITVPTDALYLVVGADGARAYAVHPGGKSITVIDTAANSVIGSIPSSQLGGDYAALAIGPNGTLYFTNYANNAVYALRPTDLESSPL